MERTILEAKNLTVGYVSNTRPAVAGLDFTLGEGETLCLHGQSGCGKSSVVWAVMGMMEALGGYVQGSLRYRDNELIGLSEKEYDSIRWKEIALVPQSSMSSFNPVYRIGKTLDEMLCLQNQIKEKNERRDICMELMELVRLSPNILDSYPYELSGGMRQRAAIALAILLHPRILILDEATTGLDVLVEADILWMLKKLRMQKNMSMLFISHDTRIANAFCDRRIEF